MSATVIFNEVEEQANSRNGEVLAKAFKRATICCEDCAYPQNADTFRNWLHDHIKAKITLHRSQQRQLVYHRTYHCSGVYRCQRCFDLNSAILEASKEARHTKHFLKKYWPCAGCIAKYNPTGRWNHPPTSNPEGQEFIDVRFD